MTTRTKGTDQSCPDRELIEWDIEGLFRIRAPIWRPKNRTKKNELTNARKQLADWSTAEVEKLVREARMKRLRELRDYRAVRPPRPGGKAGKIVFDHIPKYREWLSELITEVHQLYVSDLKEEGAGREGAAVALALAIHLLKRLPLSEQEQERLTEPLAFLQRGLDVTRSGGSVPAFIPPKGKAGRSSATSAKNEYRSEFQIRCVLAYDMLIALGATSTQAANTVYKRAKASAEWLQVNPRNGFSPGTIRNWHSRNTTDLNNAVKDGTIADVDQIAPHVLRRDSHEMFKKTFALNRRPTPTKISIRYGDRTSQTTSPEEIRDWYLSTLDLGNINRPVEHLRF